MIMGKMRLFFSSFLLQGLWNYARQQNLGMLFIMQPQLRRLYKDNPAALRAALVRNLEAFNTNPAMVGYSVGAMSAQEELIAKTPAQEKAIEEREFRIIRLSVANTAASIGDRLFWGALKPLALIVAVVTLQGGAVQVMQPRPEISLDMAFVAALAVCGALLLYNVPTMLARWRGLDLAYKGSEEDFFGLIKVDWNRGIFFLKTLGQVLAGFSIIYALSIRFKDAQPNMDSLVNLALLVTFMVLGMMMKKIKVPLVFLYIVTTLIFVAIALLV